MCPKSLLVIGGGFIGCEMAAFFSAIGTETRLFTRGDKLLGREDQRHRARVPDRV